MEQDHYAVLGIQPGADQPAIRSAYRVLMRRFHPDADPSVEAAEQRGRSTLPTPSLAIRPSAPPMMGRRLPKARSHSNPSTLPRRKCVEVRASALPLP
ncbi:J domain-containing protein [Sphingomonas daechungensis]|uniref:J domain-containing protein n=1 Tax=Sphingomonas daechungensis TaxID=1176646 RepID=UPI003CD05568